MTDKQIRARFSDNLFQKRDILEWTQEELADKAGLSKAWISHYECGRRTPSIVNLVKLINALGCSADDLLL